MTTDLALAPKSPLSQSTPDGDWAKPRKANPRKEYVIGGPWGGFISNGGVLLATVIDDVVRQYGPRVYELMVTDDAVASSIGLLKAGAIAEGAQVSPREQQTPGEIVSKRKRKAELKLSQEIADHVERSTRNLDLDFNEVIWEMMDAAPFGAEVAEMVFDEATSGPDKGRFVLSKLHVKPRWAWAMRVNRFMELLALRCWTVDGWRDVDRAHFAVATWRPQGGDPRGTSILRVAFQAWNAKTETYPDHREFMRHFADPSLIITAGENQETQRYYDAQTAQEVEVTPQEQNLEAGLAFRNRSVLSLPHGATANFMEPKTSGEAYEKAFDRWDRQIFRAIVWAARPMQEAKHGSKADTDSGMDLFSLAVAGFRRPFIRMVEQDIYRTMVELNWGPEVAARLTPKCSFGLTDHMSPDLLNAFSNAWLRGLFGPQQRPWLLHKLGAPAEEMPTPEQIQAGQTGQQPQQGQAEPPDDQNDEGTGSGQKPGSDKSDKAGKEETANYG